MGALCSHALDLTGVAGDPASRVHRLDPRAKLLGLLSVTVIAVSTPLRLWPVLAAGMLVLVVVAAAARVPAKDVWRRARGPLVLVLPVAAFVPLVRTGGSAWAVGPLTVHEAGLAVLAAVAAKTLIGVGAAVLLTATTPFHDVLRGLEALRAPRLLVLVAGLMFRYLFVVVEEADRMRTAMAARAYRPRSVLHSRTLGRLAAVLFLRSYERGERVHLAMLARGYRGGMPRLEPLTLHRADALFVGAVVVLLLPARVLGGLP